MQVHTRRRAKQLGVAEEELKLPVAVGLAACQARENDWANILTAHAGEHMAFTWQSARYRCVISAAAPFLVFLLPWNSPRIDAREDAYRTSGVTGATGTLRATCV